jgi:dTDP-4-amino-4,6-dideoxygalactose transaminase
MASCRFDVHQLQTSLQLSKEVISLPMHTELDEEQLNYIADKIKTFFL